MDKSNNFIKENNESYKTFVDITDGRSGLGQLENTYKFDDNDNLKFEDLYNSIFVKNNDKKVVSAYCFDGESGMGKSYTIRQLLKKSADNDMNVLFINFSNDSTIKFEDFNSNNIENKIFKICGKCYSFNDIRMIDQGKNVYVFFDNVKNLSITNSEILKQILVMLIRLGIKVILDYDILISDKKVIKINSIYDGNDKVIDNVPTELLKINILYLIYNKLNVTILEELAYDKKIFTQYCGKGQLLWNYYRLIVRKKDNSNEYRYLCDYIIPYLGYRLCFYHYPSQEALNKISKKDFFEAFNKIKQYFPCEFDSEKLYEKLRLVPILNIEEDYITFAHEYYSNFVSALNLINNDLIYLRDGYNPLLKEGRRTTDENYIVTDMYIELYNKGIEDEKGENSFHITKLKILLQDNTAIHGRYRNIINDIILYPIYRSNAVYKDMGNLPEILYDEDTAYGNDDFGQWSKAFCLEKIAGLYFDKYNDIVDKSAEECGISPKICDEEVKKYLIKAHNTLIGILNKNTKQSYDCSDINVDSKEYILNNYDSKKINEKRVYHILGKIYNNYDRYTGVSNCYDFYKISSSQSDFSCNLLGRHFERNHDYKKAEEWYQKSVEMGGLWANKAIVNLYLKTDFNKYYSSDNTKTLAERSELIEKYLKNINYSNVSNIFATVYKASVLKDIVKYSKNLKRNSKFTCCTENESTNNIINDPYSLFEEFLANLFDKIDSITTEIYKKNIVDKEKELAIQLNKFYKELNLLESVFNDNDLAVEKKVAGICVGIGSKEGYYYKCFGKQDDLQKKARVIDRQSIFDLASVTKLFTSIIVNILCEDDRYSIKLDSKIKDLDSRFNNLGETTVNDLLTFKVKVETDGKLDGSSDDLNKLYNSKIVDNKGNPYTDIGAIILELVIKNVTKFKFNDLVKELIVDKVTDCNISANITKKEFAVSNDFEYRNGNVYNTQLGEVHDEKARFLNKIMSNDDQICHGHAGLFASIEDLSKLFVALLNEKIVDKKILEKIATKKVGTFNGENSTQYFGELCYSKNPIAKESEVPFCFSCYSIGCGGYTGNHICIDTKNEVFTILLSNRCNNRETYLEHSNDRISTNKFAYEREDIVKKLALLALEQKFIDFLKANNN